MKTLETQQDNEVLKRTGLQGENKQLMDQVAELNTKEKQLYKVRITILYRQEIAQFGPLYMYSWFAINLLECGGQCQPRTPAGSDSGINDIFLGVVPPTWPPCRQMQTINMYFVLSGSHCSIV